MIVGKNAGGANNSTLVFLDRDGVLSRFLSVIFYWSQFLSYSL